MRLRVREPDEHGGDPEARRSGVRSDRAHYTAIGEVARTALVNYIDETSWLMHGERHWLWVMANPEVVYFQIHRTRSKAASLLLDSRVFCSHPVRECRASIIPLKNKGFKEERMAKVGVDDLNTSTTLESNKSLFEFVHNVRKRGKALLGSLIELLVSKDPGSQ